MLNFNDVKVANDKLSDFSDNNEKSTTQPLILRSGKDFFMRTYFNFITLL